MEDRDRMWRIAEFVAPFTAGKIDPMWVEEHAEVAEAELARHQLPRWEADALAGEEDSTQDLVNGARWMLAATAPAELPALDAALGNAATSGRLEELGDWLGRECAENLAETVALLLDPDEWT